MNAKGKLLLPALRGYVGDWVYYVCLMPIAELALRANYAEEIHRDEALSKLIQRSLEGERAAHISSYLEKTKQRFFNSLVLATYDGRPEWLEVGNLAATSQPDIMEDLNDQALETLGFLSLSGKEKIFAVDGQHRLAGIKQAVASKVNFDEERLPVIFISHNEAERERTRRLFTVLNKTARPVKKRDIIALDEDDTMAIVARRLVETHEWFKDPKILVVSSESLPASNRVSLTTISNLYDVLKLLFKYRTNSRSDTDLRFYRPSDGDLDRFYEFAISYFQALSKAFPELARFFASKEPALEAQQHRGEHGGHILFRPVGLIIFTAVAIEFSRANELTLMESVCRLGAIPTELTGRPYRSVIWDPSRKKMIPSGKKLAQDLLRYMVGLPSDIDLLRANYTNAKGDGKTALPRRLSI